MSDPSASGDGSSAASRHQRVSELFVRACELEGAVRTEFLRRECGGDVTLRADLEGLLAQDERAGRAGFLEQAAVPSPVVERTPPAARRVEMRRPPRRWSAPLLVILLAVSCAGVAWLAFAQDDALETWTTELAEARRVASSGAPALAEPELRRLLGEQVLRAGPGDPDSLLAARALAECLRILGQSEESAELARAVRDAGVQTLPPDHPALAGIEALLAPSDSAAPDPAGFR